MVASLNGQQNGSSYGGLDCRKLNSAYFGLSQFLKMISKDYNSGLRVEADRLDHLQLPNLWQLSQPAAMVSNELPVRCPEPFSRIAQRTGLALEIWKQSRLMVPNLEAVLNRDHHWNEEVRTQLKGLGSFREIAQNPM